MSFGLSLGDIAALTGLAWRTVQKCRKAGSQHEELTDQVTSVHLVLQRFERELLAPNSTMQGIDDTYREEIGKILRRCQKPLRLMDKLLERYNGLRNGRNNVKDLYRRVRFSNGEVGDLQELRTTLTHQTNALTLYLNIILVGASGRVERQLNESGKELREMKAAVNGIAASLIMKAPNEGTVLTSYTQDDRDVWTKFRRELIGRGFKSSFLQKNGSLIHAYVEELSNRGALDDPVLTDTALDNAQVHKEDMNVANVQPSPFVSRSDPGVGVLGFSNGHEKTDSRGKGDKSVENKMAIRTLSEHKTYEAPIASGESIPNHGPETSSSQPDKVNCSQSMDREKSPLSIWSIPDSEQEKSHPWATEEFLSTRTGAIYLQLLHYRRTHAVSLSPFFTEPPYSFYPKIEKRESLDSGDSLSSAGMPLQLAMNAPWAKPNLWLYSRGEALHSWQRWERAHGPAVDRTYVERSPMSDLFYLACPWGICLIFCGYNVSLLFADLEFVSRVVGHAEWQEIHCMAPEHRSIWLSLDSQPNSVTRFLSSSATWLVPTMDTLIWRLTICLTSEEDISLSAADHSAEREGAPTIEDVHGLACLSFVGKSLTVDLPSFNTDGCRERMALIASKIEKHTQGDSLARLVDLCVDVDRAHIQGKHPTTIPCRTIPLQYPLASNKDKR